MNGEEVKDLVIPNSVTSIGNYAFYGCGGLTAVTIPSSVTNIGQSAFYTGNNGKKYTVKMEGDTPPTIGTSTFYSSKVTIQVPQKNVNAYKSATNWSGYTIVGKYDAYIDGIYYNVYKSTMTAEVTCKDEKYNTYSGAVKIPATIEHEGESYTVTGIGFSAFRNCADLLSVKLTDNITVFDDYAFDECSNLVYLTIPNNLTKVGEYALYNCKGISTANLPEGVTSIGSYAMYGCSGLTSLTIPSSVTSIESTAFGKCTGTLNLNCSVADATYSSDDPFAGNQFAAINIGATVISIGKYVLKELPLATTLNIANGVEELGGENFMTCPNLDVVLLPNSIQEMKGNILRNFEGKLIVECSIPFYGSSTGWSSTQIPLYGCKMTSVEMRGESIGRYAFYSCDNLTDVKMSNNVKEIGGYAFNGLSQLKSVELSSMLTSIGERAFYGSGVTKLDVPNQVTTIGSYAFANLTSLSDVTIPSSVVSLGENVLSGSTGNLVVNCGNIPKNAFINTKLQSVTLGEYVETVEGYAFQKNANLETVNVKSKTLATIGDYAFDQCTKLTTVKTTNFRSWFDISFGYHGNPLCNGASLYVNDQMVENLVVPNGMEEIKKYAFEGCKSLKTIKVPQSLQSIQTGTFSNCTNLENVDVESMEAWCKIAFSDATSNPLYNAKNLSCNGVTVSDLVIPESITNIQPNAFRNCSTLKSLTIHYDVKAIGANAFNGCVNLTDVYNKRTTPQSIINNQFSTYGNLHVVKGSKDTFAAANNWKSFTIVDDIAPMFITSIGLDKEMYLGEEGDVISPVATVYPSNASYQKLEWISSDPSICNVNASTGRIVCMNAGEITLTVRATDGSEVVKTTKVRVGEYTRVTDISLNKREVALEEGENVQLVATVLPANATDKSVVWTTSNNKVATVENGLVTAIGIGDVVITATTNDGTELSATCSISVNRSVWNITERAIDKYTVESVVQCDKISYTRTFNNTNWQALYVPFSLSYDDWKDDFEVARINAFYEYDTDDDGMVDEVDLEIFKVQEGNGDLRPNYPYLIKAKATGEKTLTLTDATLYVTEENSIDCATVDTKYTFTGTYQKVNGMKTAGYYFMSGGSLKTASNDEVALGAFRWYMKAESRGSAFLERPANINIRVVGEVDTNEATSIEGLESEGDKTGSKRVYGMDGRLVSINGLQGLKAGIYLMNGKKIWVR